MDGPLGDKELAGWLHTESCGHRLIVHRETSDQWCPSGVGPGAATVQHPVGDTDSGTEGTLGKFTDNTNLCGVVDSWREGMASRGTRMGRRRGPVQTS